MTAIEADGLAKSYGETVALRDVSLAVEAGEVFALVGPNGAGKTTLVRCLTGTTDPDSGRATLIGETPEEVGKERVGLLPQDFDPRGRLTARELLAYYAGLYAEARGVEEVLADVGLTGAADTRYEDLSGGQKRRVLVGTTLVNDPEVLFLDEPTTGIDPAGRRAVWELIDDLASGGTTVFLTTHYMAEVERLADRVGVLVDGDLRTIDTPEALVREHGGGRRVVIETDATDLPGYDAESTDAGLVVEGISPDEIGGIVEALSAAGVEYDALTWREPDLETVYLELTGRSPGTGDAIAATEGDG